MEHTHSLRQITKEMARELLRHEIRLFILRQKIESPGADSNVWGPLSWLEEAFCKEHREAWDSLLTSWGAPNRELRGLLKTIVCEALTEARTAAIDSLSETLPKEESEAFSKKYMDDFQLREYLPTGPRLVSSNTP